MTWGGSSRFGPYIEGPGQEVGGAHPGLEGPKRVFDGLSSHAHGLGHAVEPGLHGVKDASVFPALTRFTFSAVHLSLRGQVRPQSAKLLAIRRADRTITSSFLIGDIRN